MTEKEDISEKSRIQLSEVIAKAIKSADRTYFFEDYYKQALKVLEEINYQGYVILPKSPTKEMIEVGKEHIKYGKSKPEELLKNIYQGMIKNFF